MNATILAACIVAAAGDFYQDDGLPQIQLILDRAEKYYNACEARLWNTAKAPAQP